MGAQGRQVFLLQKSIQIRGGNHVVARFGIPAGECRVPEIDDFAHRRRYCDSAEQRRDGPEELAAVNHRLGF